MRLVGLQYDGGEIKVGNKTFDLTIPGETHPIPSHALYSLRNGGGKGVFLQNLFQPLDPLTSWNDDEKTVGNTVYHYFYNSEGHPIDYTYHVVQEWQVSSTKKMMIGISIRPTINRREQSESPIDLSYILYSQISPIDSPNDITQLPLWDEEEQKSLPLDEWKRILNQTPDIQTYTMHNKQHYFDLLEENGISKHAITMYKRINSKEGNIDNFFSGASDNMGLFYNLIIPALNDKIEGIDSRNKNEISVLTKSFVETLKVAKELPELLAMLQSVKELNEHMEPLADLFQELDDLNREVDNQEKKGKHLVHLLTLMQEEKKSIITSKEGEIQELNEKLKELEWMRGNLEYIRLNQKLNKIEDEYANLESQQQKLELEKNILEKKYSEAKKNVLVKQYHELTQKIEEVESKLSVLEKEANVQQIKEQMQEITTYFENKWREIEEEWKEKMSEYYRLNVSHRNAISQIKKDIAEEDELNRKLEYSVMKLEEIMKEHESEEKKMIQLFGEDIRLFPDDVISNVKREHEQLERELYDTEESIRTLQSSIQNQYKKQGMIESRMERLKKEIDTNSSRLQELKEKEENLMITISSLVKEKIEEFPTRSEYQSYKQKIKGMLEKQEYRLKQQEIELQKLIETLELLKEGEVEGEDDIYIPNSELVQLKRLLEDKGLDCYYGAQYLQRFEYEDKMQLLKRNPALPYSIVVIHENFEKLDFSFLEEQLYKNHVVLVDGIHNSRLEEQKTDNPSLLKTAGANFLPKDKTFDFISEPYLLSQYKTSIEVKHDELLFALDDTNASIKKILDTLSQLDTLLGSEISKEIEIKLIRLDAEKQKQSEELNKVSSSIEESKNLIKKHESELINIQEKIADAKKKIEQLEEWQQACYDYEQSKFDLENKQLQLNESNNRMRELREEQVRLEIRMNNINNAYKEWYEKTQKNYATLRTMLKNIHFPQAAETLVFNEEEYLRTASFGYSLDKTSYEKLSLYRELLQEKGNQNSRLGKYQSDLERYQEDMATLENKFKEELILNWKEEECPSDDLILLESKVQMIQKEIETNKFFLHKVLTNIERNSREHEEVSKELENKKKELEKDFPDYGAVNSDIEDIELEKDRIKSKRKKLSETKKGVENKIKEVQKELGDISTIIISLNTLKIEGDSSVKALSEEEIIQLYEDPTSFHLVWNEELRNANLAANNKKTELHNLLVRIRSHAEKKESVPLKYKAGLLKFLDSIKDLDTKQSIQSLKHYFEWAEYSIKSEKEQKEKAEETVNLWVERTTRRMMDIIHGLEDMEKKMKIKNRNNTMFPLIKFTHHDAFNQSKEEIQYKVRDFCISKIDEFVKKNSDIDNIDIRKVAKTVNASNILLYVLGEYPRMNIYIPSIDGPLLRGEPKPAHFKDWEAINNGSEKSPTKSGGQTLLAQFIIMSMILRQRAASEDSWLFLVSDNPFGRMSAPELVEAVFSLLELLKIQWLVVAPPITNVHISSKFNTVFQMSIEMENGQKMLTKKLTKRKRKFLEEINILKDDKKA